MASEIKELGIKGDLVIPKNVRAAAGWLPRIKLKIFNIGSDVVISPANKSFLDFAGILGEKGVDHDKLEELYIETMLES